MKATGIVRRIDDLGRLLNENIDTGFGVLHGCGIGCGTIHLEVKRYSEPPSALFVADGGFGSIPARYC